MISKITILIPLMALIGEEYFTPRQEGDAPITTYYRVPDHQRFPDWKLYKKQRLVDSVLKNFPIHAIIGVEQKKIQNNAIVEWCDIEDGQTRMTYLQEFYHNKFRCEEGITCAGSGCYFKDLSPILQERFKNYQVSLEKFRGDNISSDDIAEIFTRLNSGKPLGDNDKFHSRKETAVLIYLEELKTHPELRSDFKLYIGKIGEGKKYSLLGDMIGAILAIATRHNEKACITTSYELNYKYLKNVFTHEQKSDIIAFFRAYFEMLHQQNDGIVPKPKKDLYRSLTGILGLSVCSWKEFNRIQDAISWYVGKKIDNSTYVPATFVELNNGDTRNNQGLAIKKRLEKIMQQFETDSNGAPVAVAAGGSNNLVLNFSSDDDDSDDDDASNDSNDN